MKKANITPKVTVMYNNNEEARNKLVDYIINLLLDSNTRELLNGKVNTTDGGDYRKNG